MSQMFARFAGGLARAQAFFHLLHAALSIAIKSEEEEGIGFLVQGMEVLRNLEQQIDQGYVKKQTEHERKQWKVFISRVERLDSDKVKAVLETLVV